MPIPKPKPDEEKNDYVSRFVTDEDMEEEFPDQKQRLAVAYSTWRKEHDEEDEEDE